MRSAKLRKMRSVASIKTSGGRFYVQRNRPKQGVEGGSRRPTRNDYATVERNAKLGILNVKFEARNLKCGIRN